MLPNTMQHPIQSHWQQAMCIYVFGHWGPPMHVKEWPGLCPG